MRSKILPLTLIIGSFAPTPTIFHPSLLTNAYPYPGIIAIPQTTHTVYSPTLSPRKTQEEPSEIFTDHTSSLYPRTGYGTTTSLSRSLPPRRLLCNIRPLPRSAFPRLETDPKKIQKNPSPQAKQRHDERTPIGQRTSHPHRWI